MAMQHSRKPGFESSRISDFAVEVKPILYLLWVEVLDELFGIDVIEILFIRIGRLRWHGPPENRTPFLPVGGITITIDGLLAEVPNNGGLVLKAMFDVNLLIAPRRKVVLLPRFFS